MRLIAGLTMLLALILTGCGNCEPEPTPSPVYSEPLLTDVVQKASEMTAGASASADASATAANTGEWSHSTVGEAWKNLGGRIIDEGKWGENPAEAFGEATWNLGSTLIEGVGIFNASKMLDSADEPPPSKLDLDDTARRSDVDGAVARRTDDEPIRDTTMKNARGGAPAKLPPSVTQLPDARFAPLLANIPSSVSTTTGARCMRKRP